MASSVSYLPILSFSSTLGNPNFDFSLQLPTRSSYRSRFRVLAMANSSSEGNVASQKPTKLVTFLGKGGSGKTTSAIFAAQHYAMAGLNTCLVIHSQDPTAEYLLNCKLGTSPTKCNDNLSAVRLETTKMLLEPLSMLKQADARLNMTQGVLEGVVGEELGVLPGMDSIFSAYSLERLVGFLGNVAKKNLKQERFDIIVYDGISTEEILRMIGATSKARLYLKYLRNMAEKTDLGRLAGPSILRLVDEAIGLSGRGSQLNGKMSAEIWDMLEQILERGSSAFAEPLTFGCYLVMDPENITSVNAAIRYWGCAIQAGAQVSGAFGVSSPQLQQESVVGVKRSFSPLPFGLVPHLSMGSPPDWNTTVRSTFGEEAREVLSIPARHGSSTTLPVKFDRAKKSVTLFMPGFDKSEIKLYQYRGGSELLVEAGDQRRVIFLPSGIQGKAVYSKDDFFDYVSCNALDHESHNGTTRLSEQMKIDTETLGNSRGIGVGEVDVFQSWWLLWKRVWLQREGPWPGLFQSYLIGIGHNVEV